MKLWSLVILMMLNPFISQAQTNAPPLPNQSADWLNKKTLSWDELSGKVVLLNVWTFG